MMPEVIQNLRASFLRKIIPSFLLWAVWGCAGINPAAPPGPPLEMPLALRFPESVEVDTSKAVGTEKGLFLGLAIKFGNADFNSSLRGFIQTPALDAQLISLSVGEILKPLHDQGNIPVRFPVKNFTGKTSVFLPATPNQIEHVELRIDFQDFDFDGDGFNEGCSGCTCPVAQGCNVGICPLSAEPSEVQNICFRVWANGNRFVSGYFNKIPNEVQVGSSLVVNRGAGRFQGVTLERAVFGLALEEPLGQDATLAITEFLNVLYDHGNPNDVFTDFSQRFEMDFESPLAISSDFTRLSHNLVKSRGPSEQAVKAIQQSKKTLLVGPEPRVLHQTKSVGKWREDEILWSGTLEHSDSIFEDINDPIADLTVTIDFFGICANIGSGAPIDITPEDGSPCRDLVTDFPDTLFVDFPFGIDVTKDESNPPDFPPIPFVDLLDDDALRQETVFPPNPPPNGFPVNPTF